MPGPPDKVTPVTAADSMPVFATFKVSSVPPQALNANERTTIADRCSLLIALKVACSQKDRLISQERFIFSGVHVLKRDKQAQTHNKFFQFNYQFQRKFHSTQTGKTRIPGVNLSLEIRT